MSIKELKTEADKRKKEFLVAKGIFAEYLGRFVEENLSNVTIRGERATGMVETYPIGGYKICFRKCKKSGEPNMQGKILGTFSEWEINDFEGTDDELVNFIKEEFGIEKGRDYENKDLSDSKG